MGSSSPWTVASSLATMAESRKGATMAEQQETAGMRVAFWSWMTIIVAGLVAMILVPLSGR